MVIDTFYLGYFCTVVYFISWYCFSFRGRKGSSKLLERGCFKIYTLFFYVISNYLVGVWIFILTASTLVFQPFLKQISKQIVKGVVTSFIISLVIIIGINLKTGMYLYLATRGWFVIQVFFAIVVFLVVLRLSKKIVTYEKKLFVLFAGLLANISIIFLPPAWINMSHNPSIATIKAALENQKWQKDFKHYIQFNNNFVCIIDYPNIIVSNLENFFQYDRVSFFYYYKIENKPLCKKSL